jgi:hypothetical protein
MVIAPDLFVYEEFRLFPDVDDERGEFQARAEYIPEENKIEYNLPLHAGGIDEINDTITHEWLHVLFEWAIVGDKNELAFNVHDCNGEADHYMMKLLNYDE